ncbi:MAG TPA: prolyl oligopeptidase family serine peptidase [Ktedonobacteraceae bacterium]|nr:prolyl oligopeptidase family serine peptidase [Ktedonobacteraceae bacterium]
MPQAPQTDKDALWKKRYRSGEITYAGCKQAMLASSALERGIIINAHSGTGQIYAWDVPAGTLRQITHSREGVFRGYIAPDGRFIYYVRDEGGSERGHYVRVPWEGGEEQDLTPDMPAYAAIYRCAASPDGRFFAFTPTEARGFPLYCLDLGPHGSAGRPRELYRSPKFVDDVAFSADTQLLVVATTEYARARKYSLLAFDPVSGQRIGELSDLPGGSVRAACFSPLPGDSRLLGSSDRSGFTRPLLWNPRTGERSDLLSDSVEGDIEPLDWSPDGRLLLLHQTWQAEDRLYVYDLPARRLTPLACPAGVYLDAAFGSSSQVYASWTDSTHPCQQIALDARTGTRQATLISLAEPLPARSLTSIHFTSLDGTEIQGWLGLPEGSGPFPTVLSIHGGPLLVKRSACDPDAQAWLDHGYAYLTINYRGSTTFGREFQEQIWGDLGHLEVEDMVAARNWLVEQGIAKPDAIFVTGASYGGYLTLMALGKYPRLWAGGLALVAFADLISAYYEGTDWTRGYLTAMLAGTAEEKPEQYRLSSPITYAEQVSAPLLVIQGANDLRCPPRQMENYAAIMQARGHDFEIDWFNAGHAGISLDQRLAFQERLLSFAYRVLSVGLKEES